MNAECDQINELWDKLNLIYTCETNARFGRLDWCSNDKESSGFLDQLTSGLSSLCEHQRSLSCGHTVAPLHHSSSSPTSARLRKRDMAMQRPRWVNLGNEKRPVSGAILTNKLFLNFSRIFEFGNPYDNRLNVPIDKHTRKQKDIPDRLIKAIPVEVRCGWEYIRLTMKNIQTMKNETM